VKPPRVVLVTDLGAIDEAALLERLDGAEALAPATRAELAVELRDPELSGRALVQLGERLRERTRALGAAFVVNDRLDLALALDADGVHLGRRSVSISDARALAGARWISVACHDVDDVVRAAKEGADAALLSPIFATPGKGPALGTCALRAAREALARAHLGIWLVALGGVDVERALSCFGAGADAVAAVRADLVPILGSARFTAC
jgi:thiamine-phosphate pyrophosphorylase